MLEKRFRLGEGGAVADRVEQLRCLAEWLFGAWVSEGEQAAALAEEGVGALGNVPELLPPCGRFGVEGCRVGVISGGFGELRAGGAEGVLVERVAGLEPIGEPLRETEASSYTERDTPIFVGQLVDIRAALDALDGASARVEA